MSHDQCEQCGAENAADAQFCTKCDFYLGWDSGAGKLGGAPLTSAIPVVRETYTETGQFRAQQIGIVSPSSGRRAPPRPPTPGGGPPSQPRGPQRQAPPGGPRRPSPAAPPKVSLVEPEVTVDPVAGGMFDITIQNKSSIVDGYTVSAVSPPRWLVLEQPEIRLLTEQEETFTITLRIPPKLLVFVQRFTLRLQIASVEDPSQRSDVDLVVVVPRFGPPATMVAEPRFIRLRDQTSGRFRLHLDNRNSNYPQRYGLRGNDPEGVVRFTFQPQMIEVPPGGALSVDVRFEAPLPEPGAQVMHTLTVTAANNESPVEAIVNVEHRTSQAPADQPVTVRLDPSVTRKTDRTEAEVSVVIDNRRGSKDRRLYISGRDPEGQIRFGFAQQQLYVRAGEQARVQARISAPLPRPGERVERPFSVVCTDGNVESEATGTFGIQASTSPITMAKIRLQPEHVVVRDRRKGRFAVHLDNSQGALPLRVLLSGSDPEGQVRFAFNPQHLDIPPGRHGVAAMTAEASLPGGGEQTVHEVTVSANDGAGSIEVAGRFSQSRSEILPILRMVFTLLGGLLVVLGAIRPWFSDGPTYGVQGLLELEGVVNQLNLDEIPSATNIEQLTQPAGRALILMLAGIILLGILSASGKYTIVAGALAAAAMAVYAFYALSELSSSGLAYGTVLVIVGGGLAVIGGFCIKRSFRT
jgi:hypothetical protein